MDLAWLHWNPERVVFTIPLIDRPIVAYGLWFLFGFIIGYIAILPLFQKRLQATQAILNRDIVDWPLLISLLRKHDSLITQKLTKKERQLLMRSKDGQQPSEEMQTAVLAAINVTLEDPSCKVDRAQLEKLFPKAISTLQDTAQSLVDRLLWYIVAGTLIGARLGHVFFYDWPRYQEDPFEIFRIWEGGLASHGGAVGILVALWLYQRSIRKKFPELTFLTLLDMIVIPTAYAGSCIRIGNFFNQEVIGSPSSVPWAIVLDHPADGSLPVPRHPVQLYEATVYLAIFGLLYWLSNREKAPLRTGTLSGLFFVLLFSSRFFLEFFKAPQSLVVNEAYVQMGQLLSLPFVIAGAWLLCREWFYRGKSSRAASQAAE